MSIPENVANRLASDYDLTYPIDREQLDDLLSRLALRVHHIPYDAHYPGNGFRRGKHIAVKRGLSAADETWWIAHELGHYLMHRGEQLTHRDPMLRDKQEHQAGYFACLILVGAGPGREELLSKYGLVQVL